MKKLYLMILVICGARQTIAENVSIDHKDFVFPPIAVATKPTTPQQLLASAPILPKRLNKKLDTLVSQYRRLFDSILGTDYIPYSQVRAEATRNKKLFEEYDITPYISNSNYAFLLPELSDYLIKVVRPGNRLINAIAQANLEPELNSVQSEEDLQRLFAKMDELAAQPERKLYQTYQAISALATQDRIKKAKKTYRLNRIIPAKTYAYVLDLSYPPHDRNIFLVQEFIKGRPLSDTDLLDQIYSDPRKKKKFIELLKQLFVLILDVKIWDVKDILVTESIKIMSIKMVPIDLEKRDRYVKDFISITESENLVQVGFEKMAPLLYPYPDFFRVWEDLVMRNKELQDVLLKAPHIARLYPRLMGPVKT